MSENKNMNRVKVCLTGHHFYILHKGEVGVSIRNNEKPVVIGRLRSGAFSARWNCSSTGFDQLCVK
ncbi:MAG: hypothetical protein Q8L79_04325 [Methylobacter sp.]|uniref:hypothetical protein n=1 Tax=Methylobacter sp. TaxID=2051955 RepID=UPI002731056A|nr:hypothetical protein [Methylobacter sp.]MDP1664332.1 hypothetical protein [Methylobacter sp.]